MVIAKIILNKQIHKRILLLYCVYVQQVYIWASEVDNEFCLWTLACRTEFISWQKIFAFLHVKATEKQEEFILALEAMNKGVDIWIFKLLGRQLKGCIRSIVVIYKTYFLRLIFLGLLIGKLA